MSTTESGKSAAQQCRSKMAFSVEPSNRKFRLRLARYKALAEAVAKVAERRQQGGPIQLLDVGVGSGRIMRYIEAETSLDQFGFSGIDQSPDRLRSVYHSERWQLFEGDVQRRFPFDSSQFDLVLCEQILEHLETPDRVVDEIARVLKPSGVLILGVPTFPWGISHLRRLMVGVAQHLFGYRFSHVQSFHLGTIRNLVSANDRFVIRNCYGVRVLSGGIVSKLEDFEWWYQFNRSLGRAFPSLCTEIQIVAERTTTS